MQKCEKTKNADSTIWTVFVTEGGSKNKMKYPSNLLAPLISERFFPYSQKIWACEHRYVYVFLHKKACFLYSFPEINKLNYEIFSPKVQI